VVLDLDHGPTGVAQSRFSSRSAPAGAVFCNTFTAMNAVIKGLRSVSESACRTSTAIS
jgi:hypothetical protein